MESVSGERRDTCSSAFKLSIVRIGCLKRTVVNEERTKCKSLSLEVGRKSKQSVVCADGQRSLTEIVAASQLTGIDGYVDV